MKIIIKYQFMINLSIYEFCTGDDDGAGEGGAEEHGQDHARPRHLTILAVKTTTQSGVTITTQYVKITTQHVKITTRFTRNQSN